MQEKKSLIVLLVSIIQRVQMPFINFVKNFFRIIHSRALQQILKVSLNLMKKQQERKDNSGSQLSLTTSKRNTLNLVLGADSSIVEIDESCFKRKYLKGRAPKRQECLLGMTERIGGFSKTVLIPVEDRNANTLITHIKEFVSTKSTEIMTDMWRGYNKLQALGYQHQMINHSKNFVQPNLNKVNQQAHQIHTQSIESRWSHIKNRLKRLRGQRKHYILDIFESLFFLSYVDDIEIISQQTIQFYLEKKYFEVDQRKPLDESKQNKYTKNAFDIQFSDDDSGLKSDKENKCESDYFDEWIKMMKNKMIFFKIQRTNYLNYE
ncbi:hypothetical protein ABPG72_013273 [Tetrahymena utriculariae]